MQAPLSAMIMLSLIVGVIWGGVASWLAAGTGRKRARDTVQRANQAESESRDLKNRVARLESEVRDAKAPSKTSAGPPALPPANAA
jgi:outer membrane murein-binding lipoprotein Lpp